MNLPSSSRTSSRERSEILVGRNGLEFRGPALNSLLQTERRGPHSGLRVRQFCPVRLERHSARRRGQHEHLGLSPRAINSSDRFSLLATSQEPSPCCSYDLAEGLNGGTMRRLPNRVK